MSSVIALSLASLLFVTNAFASGMSVYKTTNEDGVVEFTDKPKAASEKIKVAPMNTFDSKDQPRSVETKKPMQEKDLSQYSNVVINSPAHNSQVRDNSGNVSIIVGFEPPLKLGDSIQVVIDGNLDIAKTSKSSNVFFRNIDRGTHSAQAFIINQNGDILAESSPSVFHLLRYSSTTGNRPSKKLNAPK